MENENKEVVENDESALDKELEESLSSIKSAKVAEVAVPEKKEEAGATEEKKEEPKKETEEKTEVSEEKKEDTYEARIPNKGKFESDESYEKRIELFDLVKKRKAAASTEQKEVFNKKIETAKNQLKTLNGSDKIINPLNSAEVSKEEKKEEDPTLKADLERLKQLGGVTKEDIKEIQNQERIAADIKSTLKTFVDRHPELKDEDIREVYFDFVDSNYNWNGKTGKDLMTVLELARENMFKPSETIQERVLKGADVQAKVNAMQFPGGTIAKNGYSAEMKKSISELVATGMSEEKALELLSD